MVVTIFGSWDLCSQHLFQRRLSWLTFELNGYFWAQSQSNELHEKVMRTLQSVDQKVRKKLIVTLGIYKQAQRNSAFSLLISLICSWCRHIYILRISQLTGADITARWLRFHICCFTLIYIKSNNVKIKCDVYIRRVNSVGRLVWLKLI